NSFTAKSCCRVLNGCGVYNESLLFWVKTLLNCMAHEKKTAAASLNKEIFLECLKKSNDLSLVTHKELSKILTKDELRSVYACFLEDNLKGKEGIALYKQFFPKLALNSPEEQKITQGFIALLCSEPVNVKAFLAHILDLAKAVLTEEGHTDLASDGSDVLLWHADEAFTSSLSNKKVTKHLKCTSLQPWRERFFEIAVCLMHTLLDTTPKSEQEDSKRLKIVTAMLYYLVQGNKKRELLPPIFEKLVFSPLGLCSGVVYEQNAACARELNDLFFSAGLFKGAPHCFYKTSLILGKNWTECSLAPKEKRHHFNEVLDFLITSKEPRTLYTLCSIMFNFPVSIFERDDTLRIEAYMKIINAAFASPYTKGDITMGNVKMIDIPLLAVLSDCLLTDKRQFITYDDTNAALKGYPIVKLLTDRLIALGTEGEDNNAVTHEDFTIMVLRLWHKVAQHTIYESETQYVDLLNVFTTTPMLQKSFTYKRWDECVTTYFTLLVRPNPQEERRALFKLFVQELLKSGNKKVVSKGKTFIEEGIKKGIYQRETQEIPRPSTAVKELTTQLEQDVQKPTLKALCAKDEFEKGASILVESSLWEKESELRSLKNGFTAKGSCYILNACIPHCSTEIFLFWMTALLDCLKKEKREHAAFLEKERVLEYMKAIEEPSILTHKEIYKLFSENELQTAYARFLEGRIERADSKEAIALYKQYLSNCGLNSPQEKKVTSLAIKLSCEELDGPTMFFTKDLADSVLAAEGYTDLVAHGVSVLLFSPDEPFTAGASKKITKHLQLKKLQPLKDRFFQIAVEAMEACLDMPSKSNEESSTRLELIASVIDTMVPG
ncbi:MAG: hypothetical protein JSR46_06945, partial [Verrucomicrobia bacterium]|nr:hypothetical protein [Verrucomicrobiota bacterium]